MSSYGPDQARTGAQNARAGLPSVVSSREAGRSTYPEAARRYGARRSLRPAGWVGRLFRFLDDCRVIFFAAFAVALVALFIAEPMMRVTYPERQQCPNNLAGTEYTCSRIELPRLENTNETE